MKTLKSNRTDARKPSDVLLATRYVELKKLREMVRKSEMRFGTHMTLPKSAKTISASDRSNAGR